MNYAWPLQKQCNNFYGNPGTAGGKPSSAWQSANLVLVKCPWILRYEGSPVKGLRVHKRCAESLERVLASIWDRVGYSQAEIDRIGMSVYGGAYNFRVMRGGKALSMHSWGCAIDFDPERNGLGDKTPAMARMVIEEFEREGWEWGGHWSRPDGMHFQAAWSRANPPRLKPAPAPKFAPEVKPQPAAPQPPVAAAPTPQPQAQAHVGEPLLTTGEVKGLAYAGLGVGAGGKAISDASTVPQAPASAPDIEQLRQASENVGIVQSLTTGVVDLVNVLIANPWVLVLIAIGGGYVGFRYYRRRASRDALPAVPVQGSVVA